jgi:uncharacterized membrane protein
MLTKKYWLDKDMQQLIGNILRYGVLCSALFVLAGGLIYFLGPDQPVMDYTHFSGAMDNWHSIGGIMSGVSALNGAAIIQLGVMILIATPIARVLCSLLVFAIEKDYLYVVITLIVLSIIIYSMLNKAAH